MGSFDLLHVGLIRFTSGKGGLWNRNSSSVVVADDQVVDDCHFLIAFRIASRSV